MRFGEDITKFTSGTIREKKKFAILPTKMTNGIIVWLEPYICISRLNDHLFYPVNGPAWDIIEKRVIE